MKIFIFLIIPAISGNTRLKAAGFCGFAIAAFFACVARCCRYSGNTSAIWSAVACMLRLCLLFAAVVLGSDVLVSRLVVVVAAFAPGVVVRSGLRWYVCCAGAVCVAAGRFRVSVGHGSGAGCVSYIHGREGGTPRIARAGKLYPSVICSAD